MEQIKKEKSDFIKAKIKEIREKIVRPCTEFETKKFQYDDDICPDPYPLKPKLNNTDFPIWDGGGLDFELENEICDLKEEYFYDEEIKKFRYEDNPDKLCYYEDIADTHSYLHKFGGYPSYCQSGLGLEAIKDYHFVFQISSDNVAKYNVVDSGSLMFFYNENENKWVMYYDFY